MRSVEIEEQFRRVLAIVDGRTAQLEAVDKHLRDLNARLNVIELALATHRDKKKAHPE